MVPHGMAVALTAPEAFRFTFDADPARHLRVADLLSARTPTDRPTDRPTGCPRCCSSLMRDIGIPERARRGRLRRGRRRPLVAGTMKQQRLLATAPRPVPRTTWPASCAARSPSGTDQQVGLAAGT